MKKVPSYPKISSKTNITFNQTQNISINSPKNVGSALKKGFKAGPNKKNKEKIQNATKVEQSHSKTKVLSQKSKSSAELKRDYSMDHIKSYQKNAIDASTSTLMNATTALNEKSKSSSNKDQFKMLQNKLKALQKKIDTLKCKKKSKKQNLSSQRSRSSKVKNNSTAYTSTSVNKQPTAISAKFQKKNSKPSGGGVGSSASTSALLKKSYSEKNMLQNKYNRYHKISNPRLQQQNSTKDLSCVTINKDNNVTDKGSRVSAPPLSKQPCKKKLHTYEINHQTEENQPNQKSLSNQENQQDQLINLNPPISKKYSSSKERNTPINNFVTQVERNPNLMQRHHNNIKKQVAEVDDCYYISNAVKSLKDSDLMIFREHLIQSVQTISYLQKTRKPSMKQLQKHSYILPKLKQNCPAPLTIVLDLDQTLIHCNEQFDQPSDVTLKIKFPTGQNIDAGVNIRPYAKELLQRLSEFCQVIVFTASHECYANVVLDYLDPKHQLVAHRLFRSHCWQTQQGIYIKDLRVLKNRSLQNILLVDNAAYSYFYQLENGIPIIPFYDDKQDIQLITLLKYIKQIQNISANIHELDTIKKANQNYFRLSNYNRFANIEQLATVLYQETLQNFNNQSTEYPSLKF